MIKPQKKTIHKSHKARLENIKIINAKTIITHVELHGIHANNEENSCRIAAKPKAAEARSPKPEAKSQKPKARSQKPEAKSQKPKARSQKPEAKSQKPKARSQKPEAKSQKPKARSQKPAKNKCKKKMPLPTEMKVGGPKSGQKRYIYFSRKCILVTFPKSPNPEQRWTTPCPGGVHFLVAILGLGLSGKKQQQLMRLAHHGNSML